MPHIARMVAATTESDPGAESERTSHNTPGQPGSTAAQSYSAGDERHEPGKAFGCSVRCR